MPSSRFLFVLPALVVATLPFSRPAIAGNPVNTITVGTTSDVIEPNDGVCSLREAVLSANFNMPLSADPGECPAGSVAMTDVIVLQSGSTYTLTLIGNNEYVGDLNINDNPGLDADTADLRFQTSGDARATIRQGVDLLRVMEIDSDARVEIDNLVLRDGDAGTEPGGAIYTKGGHVALTRSVITASRSDDGGGIAVVNGSVRIEDSQLLFNVSTTFAGALSLYESTAVLRHVTMQGNTASFGGGILSNKSDLVVEEGSVFRANTASVFSGGALYAESSTVLVRDATLEQNASVGSGGAIYQTGTSGSLAVENTDVTDNAARNGGGILMDVIQAPVVVAGSRFVGNKSLADGTAGGGAIVAPVVSVSGTRFESNRTEDPSAEGGAILTTRLIAKDCEFIGNVSMNGGGAATVYESVEIEDCRFSLNEALRGGALSMISLPGLSNSIVRSVFSDNTATAEGGALWVMTPDAMRIANATFSGNTTQGTGSAIFLNENGSVHGTNVTVVGTGAAPLVAKYGSLQLENSLLQSPDGDDCLVSPNDPLVLSLGHNFSDDDSCFGLDQPGDVMEVDAMLGPLADNGGGTLTHALLEGSPAIDAGNGIACQAAPVDGVDQRGVSRASGLNCDIGAYEYTAPPPDLPIELFADGFED